MDDLTITAPTPVPDHAGRSWSALIHGKVFPRQTVIDRDMPGQRTYNTDDETVRLEHHSDQVTNVARLLPEDAMHLADQLNAAAHAIITRRIERHDQEAEQAEAQHIVAPD